MKPGRAAAVALLVVGDGVAHLRVGDFLDRGGEEAHFAGAERFDHHLLGREHADALDLIDGIGRHHADFLALLQFAIDDAHQHDDAEIGVVPAIHQQRLERRIHIALGRGQASARPLPARPRC